MTTKLLYLVRHAKSAWPETYDSDFNRPLNKRGERDAPRIARYLAELGCKPDIIISSAAERAITTASHLAKGLGYADEIAASDDLYFHGIAAYVDALSDMNDDFSQVLLVAHNPTISDYSSQLTGRDLTMPTCGVAVIEGKWQSWPAFATGGGVLLELITPKQLPA